MYSSGMKSDPYREAFLKRFRKRLIDLGINQGDVAKRMGTSPATVTNLLSGNHTYPLDTLKRLAAALEWDFVKLASEMEGVEYPDTPAMAKITTTIRNADPDRAARMNARASKTKAK